MQWKQLGSQTVVEPTPHRQLWHLAKGGKDSTKRRLDLCLQWSLAVRSLCAELIVLSRCLELNCVRCGT